MGQKFFIPTQTLMVVFLLIPLSVIFESVETFIRIVGLYLGVVPPTCILVLSILWLFTV